MIKDEYTAQQIAKEIAFEAAKSNKLLDFGTIRAELIEAEVDPALYRGLEKTCFATLLAEGILEDTGEKTQASGRSFVLFKSLIF